MPADIGERAIERNAVDGRRQAADLVRVRGLRLIDLDDALRIEQRKPREWPLTVGLARAEPVRASRLVGDEAGSVKAASAGELLDLPQRRIKIRPIAYVDDAHRLLQPQPSRAAIDLNHDVGH